MRDLKHYFKEKNGVQSSGDCVVADEVKGVGDVKSRVRKKKKRKESKIQCEIVDASDEKGIGGMKETTNETLNDSLEDFENCVEKPDLEVSASTTKLNAFQFMMESRAKSIGHNSPGKEKTIEIPDENESAAREKRLARKTLFQEWSDRKGGLKRKRKEQETDEIIKEKLEKRAERLKRMLKSEVESESNILKIKMFSPKKLPKKSKEKRKKSPQIVEVIEIVDEANKPTLRRSSRIRKPNKRIDYDDFVEKHVQKQERKPTLKLAPIFMKKPPIDSKMIEAKKNFLYSGLPDTLKKTIDKQNSFERRFVELFPKISHIQQKNPENQFWNLTTIKNFKFIHTESPIKAIKLTKNFYLNSLPTITNNSQTYTLNPHKKFNIRLILKQIKAEHPEFPVYKIFRLLRKKTRKNQIWTEKYRPNNTEELLGNTCAVRELKNWLKHWLDLSGEIASKRRKRNNSDSSTEFDTSDGDSRDSMGFPSNTIIVSGVIASGKTMAIYAIANELDINVLELNASSKRTGKCTNCNEINIIYITIAFKVYFKLQLP